MVSRTNETKAKRSSPRYWVEIKGKLYARLQYKAENGKYKVKYKPISDKRTARSVVEEMRRELELHGEETFQTDKMTFREFAEVYKKAKLSPAVFENGVKISGRKSNVDWAYNALVEYFGARRLRSIKPADLEAYKQKRLKTPIEIEYKKKVKVESRPPKSRRKYIYEKHIKTRPRKIATVNRELSFLRAMLSFALQNDWIIQNPFVKAKGVIAVSAEIGRDRILSFDEENRLLAVCVEKRAHLKPILICALDTAMRRGEIFKMRWKDVNFVKNEIFIPQTNTKTEDSRTVGITPRLKQELERLWEISPKDLGGLVFGITNSIKHSWATACRLANIDDFHFHDCRHTATTRMIASGSPHTEVMKITGHSQLRTFLRYLNVTSETANNVALRLNDYLLHRQIQIPKISDSVN